MSGTGYESGETLRLIADLLELERLNAEVAVLRDCNVSLTKQRDLLIISDLNWPRPQQKQEL